MYDWRQKDQEKITTTKHFKISLYFLVKPSLIFYNTPTTWPEARTFCANVGGKLASRSSEMTSHVTKDSQLVWTGTYQTFSNFAAKIGKLKYIGRFHSQEEV